MDAPQITALTALLTSLVMLSAPSPQPDKNEDRAVRKSLALITDSTNKALITLEEIDHERSKTVDVESEE